LATVTGHVGGTILYILFSFGALMNCIPFQ
jgi:hypothetical protein